MSGHSGLSATLDAEKTRRAGGASGQWQPASAELVELVARHALVSIDTLHAKWDIAPQPRGRFVLTAQLVARFAAPCVVSLEPVPQAFDEIAKVAFWPADQLSEADPDALADAPEPIVEGMLEIGRVLAEEFGVRIDPFPRAAEAALPAAATDETGHPFAALRALRP